MNNRIEQLETLLEASGRRMTNPLNPGLHQPMEDGPTTTVIDPVADMTQTMGEFGLLPAQLTMLDRAAHAGIPLLLQGEFGTGKQTLARRRMVNAGFSAARDLPC